MLFISNALLFLSRSYMGNISELLFNRCNSQFNLYSNSIEAVGNLGYSQYIWPLIGYRQSKAI